MEAILKVLNSMLTMALELLPDSPFRPFIDQISGIDYLGYLNYFVPVGDFISLLSAWTTAIVLFYAVSAILRMVKAIN